MKIITLDLTDCKFLLEIHKRIRDAFDFPEWYGENWNAFWDLLWSECDADKVIVKGENTLPKDFKEDIDIMHEVLDDCVNFRKKYNLNPFTYEIID